MAQIIENVVFYEQTLAKQRVFVTLLSVKNIDSIMISCGLRSLAMSVLCSMYFVNATHKKYSHMRQKHSNWPRKKKEKNIIKSEEFIFINSYFIWVGNSFICRQWIHPMHLSTFVCANKWIDIYWLFADIERLPLAILFIRSKLNHFGVYVECIG